MHIMYSIIYVKTFATDDLGYNNFFNSFLARKSLLNV